MKSVNRVYFIIIILLLGSFYQVSAQTCTSNPTTLSSDINFASVVWTGTGITAATCAAIANGSNTTTTANFDVNLANGVILTISNNVTIHGNFKLTNNGTGATLSVNGGGSATMLYVTGDLGDNTNNNIVYNVQSASDKIKVDGTLYGKNSNGFQGSGSISGGSLSIGTGGSCSSPCPVSGGFTTCNSGDAFCANNNVLPITLLDFSGMIKENVVKLSWSTATELNFDYFDVQKSNDGENFSTLSKVPGHGTSYDRHDYSLIDTNPIIGKNYYRLKSVDFDGYTETFKIIGISYSAEGSFTIFPNPSDGNLIHYRLNYIPEGPFIIAVYDHLGNVISRTSPESISQEIELSRSLSSGVYYAKLITESSVKVERFIVK